MSKSDIITVVSTITISAIAFIGMFVLKFFISCGACLTAIYVAHHCFHWF